MQLPKNERGRYKFFILCYLDGSYAFAEIFPFHLCLNLKWWASASLSRVNNWHNLSVNRATDYSVSFRQVLSELVNMFPELLSWVVSFDGPYIPVPVLLNCPINLDISTITFYHGTSTLALDFIQERGLLPRKITGVDPAYGCVYDTVKQGRTDAIYLTTQQNMARFAARDATKVARRLDPKASGVVLRVRGIDPTYIIADEDAFVDDPIESLERIGSIAYTRNIPPKLIEVDHFLD